VFFERLHDGSTVTAVLFVTLVPFIVLWLVIGLVIWMVRGYLSSRR
jgi:hypothetical protein